VASAGVPRALDTPRCAARVRADALFVHHPRDEVAPFAHAERIRARYGGPARLVVSRIADRRSYHLVLGADEAAREAVGAFVTGRLRPPP
jgi:hypothetical protein